MTRTIRAVDLMCGLGGTSEGLRLACEDLGVGLDLDAVNHWPMAIEMHRANHKGRSLNADLYDLDPRDIVPEGQQLDLLVASPTCITHSRCRGGRPISWDQRRGRMTPVQVLRWMRDLRPTAVLVENVPEMREWTLAHPEFVRGTERPITLPNGKIGTTGTPIELSAACRAAACKPGKQCKRRIQRVKVDGRRVGYGTLFRAWIKRAKRIGYRLEDRLIVCADQGDATTRQRLFMMFRLDEAAIAWPSPTHSKGGVGGLKPYVAARTVIDPTIKSRSIFGRKKPYSQKSLARLLDGARKNDWDPRHIAMVEYHKATGKDPRRLKRFRDAFNVPEAVPLLLSQHSGGIARPIDEPAPAQVARHSHRLVQAGEALILHNTHGGRRDPRPASEPLPTVTTANRGELSLAQPFVLRTDMHQSNSACVYPQNSPLPTVTTARSLNVAQASVHDDAMLVVLRNNADGRSLDLPVPTVVASGNHLMLAKAFMPAANGERPGQAPRSRSVDEPVPTVCARGRVQLAQAGRGRRRGYRGPDVYMRLLVPRELAGAHSFRADYQLLGTTTDQVRAVGNSVPVETARALTRSILRTTLAWEARRKAKAAGPLFALEAS